MISMNYFHLLQETFYLKKEKKTFIRFFFVPFYFLSYFRMKICFDFVLTTRNTTIIPIVG